MCCLSLFYKDIKGEEFLGLLLMSGKIKWKGNNWIKVILLIENLRMYIIINDMIIINFKLFVFKVCGRE